MTTCWPPYDSLVEFIRHPQAVDGALCCRYLNVSEQDIEKDILRGARYDLWMNRDGVLLDGGELTLEDPEPLRCDKRFNFIEPYKLTRRGRGSPHQSTMAWQRAPFEVGFKRSLLPLLRVDYSVVSPSSNGALFQAYYKSEKLRPIVAHIIQRNSLSS